MDQRKPCCGNGACPACECCICVCVKKLSPSEKRRLKEILVEE